MTWSSFLISLPPRRWRYALILMFALSSNGLDATVPVQWLSIPFFRLPGWLSICCNFRHGYRSICWYHYASWTFTMKLVNCLPLSAFANDMCIVARGTNQIGWHGVQCARFYTASNLLSMQASGCSFCVLVFLDPQLNIQNTKISFLSATSTCF